MLKLHVDQYNLFHFDLHLLSVQTGNQELLVHSITARGRYLTLPGVFIILGIEINSKDTFMSRSYKLRGFTLIEILVVVALIAILAAVTIVAINPGKNFADTRNATRSADVNQILNAVTQYTSEEGHAIGDLGTIPACADTTDGLGREIGSGEGLVDLAGTALVDEYIVGIPEDPQEGSPEKTGYFICLTAGGRVQITAGFAENDKDIVVMR
ncbi:MAG: prepilin-type N-terminal cleavage/methylation domain-containing protein [Candidatus Dojkabacteria bacterium]|nr:prepilin-type N-terminal cleavage/methylation domain-containing protein [Candidatus Dojkabacteria bacterium]